MPKRYWLLKTEPEVYSIDDLKRDGETCWDGVRNYQARNTMRDDMKVGDEVFFYHSNADPTGIAGIAKVSKAGHDDVTALDPNDVHYDPKATSEKPIWSRVNVKFVRKFPRVITLDELKPIKELTGLPLLQRGQRLSVQPVSAAHFEIIKALAR